MKTVTVTHWPANAGQVTINKVRARLEQEGLTPCRFDMLPGDAYGDHAHPDAEIRWVVSGRMRILVDDEEIVLEPGDRLAVLSLVAFFALLARAFVRLRVESRRLAAFLVAVLLSGPMLWYGRTSFGEMLAALFTLGFAVQCQGGNSDRLLFVEGLLAGISKETAFPFVLLLGASASFGSGERWKDPSFRWRRSKLLVLTALASLILNVAFNWLRFGTPLNRSYVDPRYIVSSLERQASYFFGLWFSPNGGLLLFWPSFVLLLVLSAQQAVRGWRAAADLPTKLGLVSPVAGMSLALLGLTLGFSRWALPLY